MAQYLVRLEDGCKQDKRNQQRQQQEEPQEEQQQGWVEEVDEEQLWSLTR